MSATAKNYGVMVAAVITAGLVLHYARSFTIAKNSSNGFNL